MHRRFAGSRPPRRSDLPAALAGLLERTLLLLPLFMAAGFFSGTETALLSLSMAQREAMRQAEQQPGGDAARQLTYGLHFLSLSQALLEVFLLGGIDHINRGAF